MEPIINKKLYVGSRAKKCAGDGKFVVPKSAIHICLFLLNVSMLSSSVITRFIKVQRRVEKPLRKINEVEKL